jgi:uncharacterized membrane protein YgaE (UPF0421/DUF939 family)
VEVPQAVRVVIAAGVSWQLCMWILNGPHGHPPVYAAVVPLVAMRDHPYSAFNVSLDRLVGVLAGVCLGIAVVQWLGLSTLAVVLVLAVGLIGGIALQLGPGTNIQVAASSLLVFSNPDPNVYAFARLWRQRSARS